MDFHKKMKIQYILNEIYRNRSTRQNDTSKPNIKNQPSNRFSKLTGRILAWLLAGSMIQGMASCAKQNEKIISPETSRVGITETLPPEEKTTPQQIEENQSKPEEVKITLNECFSQYYIDKYKELYGIELKQPLTLDAGYNEIDGKGFMIPYVYNVLGVNVTPGLSPAETEKELRKCGLPVKDYFEKSNKYGSMVYQITDGSGRTVDTLIIYDTKESPDKQVLSVVSGDNKANNSLVNTVYALSKGETSSQLPKILEELYKTEIAYNGKQTNLLDLWRTYGEVGKATPSDFKQLLEYIQTPEEISKDTSEKTPDDMGR